MLRRLLRISVLMLSQSAALVAQDAVSGLQPSQITVSEASINGTIVDRFTRVLVTEKISGGVVTINDSCSRGQSQTVHISAGTTLDRALDIVINSDNKSQWVLQDGVVNLLPTGRLPDLLNIQVSNFEWDKTAPAEEVLGNLLQSAKVAKKAKDLGLEPAMAEGGASVMCIRNCEQHTKPQPLMATANDAIVLSILNQIVAAHPRTVWSYSEFNCQGKHQFEFAIAAK